jgi:hypothetical protein
MQTNWLFLVSGILRLPLENKHSDPLYRNKGTEMSKTASIGFAPSNGLFGRLIASIDRLLMTSARASVRNGDLPYFGL